MAFPDPQSATIGSVISMPKTVTDLRSSTFESADSSAKLFLNQTNPSKGRRNSYAQLTRRKISTDVLTDVKSYITAQVSITINRPEVGFTEVELIELITGLTSWLTAGTNANAKRLLGLES